MWNFIVLQNVFITLYHIVLYYITLYYPYICLCVFPIFGEEGLQPTRVTEWTLCLAKAAAMVRRIEHCAANIQVLGSNPTMAVRCLTWEVPVVTEAKHWLTDSLIHWLTDWLTGWLTDSLTHSHFVSPRRWLNLWSLTASFFLGKH